MKIEASRKLGPNTQRDECVAAVSGAFTADGRRHSPSVPPSAGRPDWPIGHVRTICWRRAAVLEIRSKCVNVQVAFHPEEHPFQDSERLARTKDLLSEIIRGVFARPRLEIAT